MPKRIFGREPALVIALLSAVTGAAIAAFTRPISPGAYTAVVAASVALVQGFGLDVAPETIGAINGLVVAGLALVSRWEVSPKDNVDPAVLPRIAENSDMALSSSPPRLG